MTWMWNRYLLGALLAFGALNAFADGYYGLSGVPGVPLDWLAGAAGNHRVRVLDAAFDADRRNPRPDVGVADAAVDRTANPSHE